ncbi:hypothetical protein [Paenibacillus selenitireducens]|uniref:hypothetical protein n=1 Tax=Paenibacillus selenitireducens TaxID=1324314 RepID=UPI001301F705|nr:hypothetical protein [Paenibacillus selenitireducens]
MSKPAAVTTYTKEQVLGSQRFSNVQKDILGALLGGDQECTLEQAEKLIQEFEKKEVR